MKRIGHILGAAGLLYALLWLLVPLSVLTLIRVVHEERRPSRTWDGWLIMCRTAFHLLAAIRPNRRLG